MDLPTLFVALLIAAGAVWLIDVTLLKPRRRRFAASQRVHGARETDPLLVQYARRCHRLAAAVEPFGQFHQASGGFARLADLASIRHADQLERVWM
jgi:hypothetical protein